MLGCEVRGKPPEELAKLCRTGVPMGHMWSDLLVPNVWLTLPVYGRRLLLPAMIGEGVAMEPLLRLMKFCQRQGIMLPEDLVAWMRARTDLGGGGMVLPFGYLLARVQERITELAGIRQHLALALAPQTEPAGDGPARQRGRSLHGLLGRPTRGRRGPGVAWWVRAPPPPVLHGSLG